MMIKRKLKSLGVYSGAAVGLIYGGAFLMGQSDKVNHLIGGLIRGMRCGLTGIDVARKYLKEGINDETHDYAAKKFYKVFKENSGCYIKLGQIICQLQHILPEAYVRELEPLCMECPTTDFQTVHKFMDKQCRKYLNTPVDLIFDKIEPVPIGSASIAQVHKGYLRDGTPVAIKVQHSHIPVQCPGDIMTVTLGCYLAEWLFPEFKYKWLAKEFQINLPKEIDFNNEGKNADTIRELFKDDSRVVIPKIYWEYSTPTILVMSYEEGKPITDSKYIKENNICIKEIAKNLTDIFNKQIFKYGFVHSDPHPGNIFVRNEYDSYGRKKLKIVLLDHGLYRDLDNHFRLNYINLWRGIILQDKQILKKSCNNLGIDKVELFMSILTSRTYDDLMNKSTKYNTDKRLGQKKSEEEKAKLKKYAQIYHKEITQVLSGVRREMLLLLKINEFLRNIDRRIGNPYNTIENTIEHIYSELRNFNDVSITRIDRLLYCKEYLHLKFVIKFLEIIEWTVNILFSWWPSAKKVLTADEVFQIDNRALI